mgnify:CR=1 FL=1
MDSPKLCNPLVLAYQGDVVYELLVRRRLIGSLRPAPGNGKAGLRPLPVPGHGDFGAHAHPGRIGDL